VAAWRDLKRGVEGILGLDQSRLEALLIMDRGHFGGEASELAKDITKVSIKLSEALQVAERKLAAKESDEAQAKARRKARQMPAPQPQPKVEAAENGGTKKPKVGRMSRQRGVS
jgi:hypothetical protein